MQGQVRSFALFLALSLVLWAQRTDTVYERLATDASADPLTTAVVRNIGQSYHTGIALFANAKALTCNQPGGAFVFLVSFDGSTWFSPFQNQVENTSIVDAKHYTTIEATGAYPYLKLQLSSWDEVNCTVSIYYSGTVAPTFASPLRSSRVNSTAQRISRAPFSIAAAGNTDVLVASAAINQSTNIYGLYLYNEAQQDITIQEAQSGGAFVTVLYLKGLPAGAQVNIPNTGVGQYSLLRGSGVRIITTAATVVSGYLLYIPE